MNPNSLNNGRGTDETGIIFHSTKTTLPIFYIIETTINGQAVCRQIPSIFIARYPELIIEAKNNGKDFNEEKQAAAKYSGKQSSKFEKLGGFNPVLQLGSTLSFFMSELGLLRTGGARGDITRLRNQIKRLFSSTVICHYEDSRQDVGTGFNITSQYHLWWDAKMPHQIPLWKSTVTLGTDFFKEIIKSPVPIDMMALKQLKRSPMALDIYFWLTHRMFYLRSDTVIPWQLLQMQFGADYPADGRGPLDFKRNFLLRLKQVLAIYDTAVAFPVDGGLLLKPSPPHVAKQPIPFKVVLFSEVGRA